MDFIKKIRQILDSKALTKDALAEYLGMSRQTLDNYLDETTSPTSKKEKEFLKKLDVLKISSMAINRDSDNINSSIPFYDAIAVGGNTLLADQTPINMPSQMIDPGSFLRTASGSLRIYGHSMFPKYPAGCIVAFKSADLDVIIWGEDYVIELEDRRIIKRLEKCDIIDCVKAVSYNKSEDYQYAPVEIPT